MHILLIRHGVAQEREEFAGKGKDDAMRPLTKSGRRKMDRAAKGLHRIVPQIDLLASSPLLRAAETAEIIAGRYNDLPVIEIAHLSPRKQPTSLLEWLQAQPSEATVALVGHEPNLSVFAGWLMTGLQESFLEFKKGSACLLEASREVKAGRARLIWALRPGQLRAMGK